MNSLGYSELATAAQRFAVELAQIAELAVAGLAAADELVVDGPAHTVGLAAAGTVAGEPAPVVEPAAVVEIDNFAVDRKCVDLE